MMQCVIAVEDSLTPVREALQDRGYMVVSMTGEAGSRADALVISGGDDDVLGVEKTETDRPVVVAAGMSADEVCRAVERQLGR